ncbi:MAG: PHP domain-containing protein, partial [Candidatus Nanopelagicales bacterium]|nr:PHP domain-containing protein [Candidatus Nanopelagicales bacterium]
MTEIDAQSTTRRPSGYAELHAHSSFSFLDGVSPPADLVAEAQRLELDALAVLDHDGFYGIVQTATAAREVDLPTVIGAELSIGLTERHNGVPDPSGRHLVVLARDPEGYRRLSRVISRANLAGSKGLPKYDWAALADEHDGRWAILTGCRKGTVPAALARSGPEAAERALAELIDMFGCRNVYVELWHHHDPADDERNDALAELAAKFGLPTVATTNAHYATPSEHRLARVVAAIRSRGTLADLDGWMPAAPAAHLRSAEEQRRRFAAWPGAVDRAGLLGRELAFDLSLIAPRLPDFPTPPGQTEDDHLLELVTTGATRLYGPRESERIRGAWRQIDHELRVIAELGFAGYFLVVWDIVQFCRHHDIYCQGRGSAANSAVCYSMGITNADPVALGLLFERFLSPARDGPPDIDVDIESGRREEAIQYVYTRYGRDHAAQVANVITYRTRSARRDAARAFGHATTGPDLPDQVRQTAENLLHLPRHLGVHSGGMVICDRPIIEVCPVEWATTPARSVLQWDKDDCAEAGLVKFDLLGLGMLEAIHRTVDLVREHQGEHIDLALLPQEPEVYERLCAADTVGVFQVESRAQMATLPRLKPRNFHDLVVEVALIRPGPIQGGSVHPYLRRRSGQEPITYLHPLLERSLAKTLGVPIFQEQ